MVEQIMSPEKRKIRGGLLDVSRTI